MVITMLVSVAVLAAVAVGMLLIMSKRTRELPRQFEPRVARANPSGSIRTNGEED